VTYQTPWKIETDPGAYAHLKINDTVCALPVEEQAEYEKLQDVGFDRRSAAQQERMEELWRRGEELRVKWRAEMAEPTESEAFFEDLKTKMWSKVNAGSEGPSPASS
jgi:hypothetical protein